MRYKFWKKQSKQSGKPYQEINAMVNNKYSFYLNFYFSIKFFKLFFFLLVAIKKYIVGLIIKNSSDSATLEKEKVYVNKLNVILIQVI